MRSMYAFDTAVVQLPMCAISEHLDIVACHMFELNFVRIDEQLRKSATHLLWCEGDHVLVIENAGNVSTRI